LFQRSVFAFLDPVFNISASTVNFDHLVSRKPGIGYDEIVPGKQFTKVPDKLPNTPRGMVQHTAM
jgi:hypothetical protein